MLKLLAVSPIEHIEPDPTLMALLYTAMGLFVVMAVMLYRRDRL